MSDGTIRAKINTLPKYIVKTDESNGRLVVTDPLTVKNAINDPLPVRLDQLRDVNTALIQDGALLVYNANTEEYDVKLPVNLTVTNTLSIYKLSANGSLGTPGMFLTSNGSGVYWSNDVDLVSNNSLLLNGKPEQYYTNATNIVSGTLNINFLPPIDGGIY